MHRKFFSRAVVVLVMQVTAGAAFGQFAWIDANGVRQYSDRPPPPSVPKNKILKTPMGAIHAPSETAAGSAAGTDPAVDDKPGAAKPPMTTAEKNADFVKRRSDQAESDRKAAEAAKAAAIKSKNCEKAQDYARSLQSGERIASLDKNGERTFMSDEKRSQEMADNRRTLGGCK